MMNAVLLCMDKLWRIKMKKISLYVGTSWKCTGLNYPVLSVRYVNVESVYIWPTS